MSRPIFNDPKELQAKIDDFFIKCAENKKQPTKTGLCVHLDVLQDSLNAYIEDEANETYKPYSPILKKAYRDIEDKLLERLMSPNGNVAGVIFYLKNAFKYRDRQDLDISSQGDKIEAITYVIPDKKKEKPKE